MNILIFYLLNHLVVISMRDDSKCYNLAELRKNNYGQAIFMNIFDTIKQ